MTRSAAECLQAVLANLQMAKDVHQDKAKLANREGRFHDYREHAGFADAFQQAIDLIRAECQSVLEG